MTVLSPITPAICAAMFARAVAGQSLAVLSRKEGIESNGITGSSQSVVKV
jgi:hypothetical protein